MCRDQLLMVGRVRRVSLAMLEDTNPGGQVWDSVATDPARQPYGTFEGKTIFEAAQHRVGPEGPQTVTGYLPSEQDWAAPNLYEDNATGGKWKAGQFNGSTQLPEHKVWFFYLARICNHCTYPGCLCACP